MIPGRPAMHWMKLWAQLLLVGASSVAMAQDPSEWPNWRGPRLDGTSVDANPPVRWSETENVRFKVAIPGESLASPIVHEGRVYVVTAVAGDADAYAKYGSDDCQGLGRFQLLAQPFLMTSGDVAGFVCQYADDLVGRISGHKCPGVNKNATANHKGVEIGIVDQNDLDVRFSQTGCLQNGSGIFSDQRFYLGIPDDRHLSLCRRVRDHREGHLNRQQKDQDRPQRGPPNAAILQYGIVVHCTFTGKPARNP